VSSPSVATILRDHVSLSISCVDRLYLNGYVPLLQVPGHITTFCRQQLNAPIASPALFGPLLERFTNVLSTASNTSAVGGPAAAAAHLLDSVTVHTGTAFTTSSAPGASTSARHCQPALSCSPMPTNPTHPTRRTPHHPRRPELSPARETGDRLGIWRRALARLGQPCGLPTYPQTDDYALASLAVYHSKQRLSDQSDAGSAVPVLSRLNPSGCPTFILAFTMNNDVRQRSVHHNLGIRRSCVSSGFVGAEDLGGVLRGRMLCHLDDAPGRPVACTRRNKTGRANPSRVIRTPGTRECVQHLTRCNANRNAG
jgi:hypothetical protein